MSPVSLILNFHKLARVALKVIVGALESDPRTRDIRPPAAGERRNALRLLDSHQSHGATVVLKCHSYILGRAGPSGRAS
jgi:hypothetical protein